MATPRKRAVAAEYSSPDVVMMQSAQDRQRHDIADRLCAPEVRRILLQ